MTGSAGCKSGSELTHYFMRKWFPLLLIVGFLVLSPWFSLPGLGLYDSKRVFQLILFGVLAIWYMCCWLKNREYSDRYDCQPVLGRAGLSAILLVIIGGAVSVFGSYRMDIAILEFSLFLLLILFVFRMAPLNRMEHFRLGRIIFGTALLYLLLYLTLFTGNYILSLQSSSVPLWPGRMSWMVMMDGEMWSPKEVLYFANRRFFNHTQTWTLPILIALLALWHRKGYSRRVLWALFFSISLWWALLLASGGRGTLFGVLLSLVLLWLLFGRQVTRMAVQTLGSLGVGWVLYTVLFRWIPDVMEGAPIARIGSSGRYALWERSIEQWISAPFFGIGPMHFARMTGENPTLAHPHNFYLQFLSEWGALATAGLICLLYLSARGALRYGKAGIFREENRLIYIGMFWAMLAAWIHAGFSGVMHTPLSQIWLLLIAAWLIGYARYNGSDRQPVLPAAAAALLILMFTVIVFVYAVPEIGSLSEGYKEYLERFEHRNLYPRFWEQGLFE
ncbi:MAG: O-antigen ligase family protein [Balneolaceae bacterium]